MTTWFIIGFLAIMTIMIAIISTIVIIAAKKAQKLEKQFIEFVSAVDDKTPSPLSQFISLESKVIAQDLIMQVKTTMMGKVSGENRGETAMMGDVVQDIASSQSPILGLILDQFPTLKKRIAKNPQMAFGAMQLLQNQFGQHLNATNGGNGHVSVGKSDGYTPS